MIVRFGLVDGENRLHVSEIVPAPDPDPRCHYHEWFDTTGETVSLDGYRIVHTVHDAIEGRCVDTAEYFSPAASIIGGLLRNAPDGAELAGVKIKPAVGTRTWREEYEITFYGNDGGE